jgi:hypothetical protein
MTEAGPAFEVLYFFNQKQEDEKFLTYNMAPMVSQSASGPYLSSDRLLSVKLVPNFADRGCHMVSAVNPHGRNFDFLNQSRYYFF